MLISGLFSEFWEAFLDTVQFKLDIEYFRSIFMDLKVMGSQTLFTESVVTFIDEERRRRDEEKKEARKK